MHHGLTVGLDFNDSYPGNKNSAKLAWRCRMAITWQKRCLINQLINQSRLSRLSSGVFCFCGVLIIICLTMSCPCTPLSYRSLTSEVFQALYREGLLSLPRTAWWLRRCERVLSISGWSSLRTRWPEWSPGGPHPALTGSDITKYRVLLFIYFSPAVRNQSLFPFWCFQYAGQLSSNRQCLIYLR